MKDIPLAGHSSCGNQKCHCSVAWKLHSTSRRRQKRPRVGHPIRWTPKHPKSTAVALACAVEPLPRGWSGAQRALKKASINCQLRAIRGGGQPCTDGRTMTHAQTSVPWSTPTHWTLMADAVLPAGWKQAGQGKGFVSGYLFDNVRSSELRNGRKRADRGATERFVPSGVDCRGAGV